MTGYRRNRKDLTARILCTLVLGACLIGVGHRDASAEISNEAIIRGINVYTSTGVTASAWGVRTRALGRYSTAFGYETAAGGDASTVWGWASEARGQASTAWGWYAKASGDYSTAFGYRTTASGKNATAFGDSSKASGENAMAFGYGSTASGKNATAFGWGSTASGHIATAFGWTTIASNYNSTAFGNGSIAEGKNATAFGLKTTAGGENATAFGSGTKARGFNTTAWGNKTEAGGTHSMAFGDGTEATGTSAAAFGAGTIASGDNSTVFGIGSKAEGKNSLAALGGMTDKSAENSAAIGVGAYAVLADSIALGSGAEARRMAGAAGYVFGGGTAPAGLAWKSTHAAVAVGSATVSRQITGVAAGSQDTDAVNLAQLKQAVSTVAGGTGADTHTTGAALGADKKLTFMRTDGFTYDVDLSSLAGGESGTGTDTYTTGVNVSGNTVTFTRNDGGTYDFALPASSGGGGMDSLQFAGDEGPILTKTDGQKLEILGGAAPGTLSKYNIGVTAEGGALRIKLSKNIRDISSISVDSGVKIDEKGLHAGDKKITGVAAGEAETDAVNVGQLHKAIAADVAPLSSHLTRLDSKINKMGAGAAALAALHPLDMDNKFDVAAGFGNYRNANAVALGLFYRPDENVMISAGGTMGNGENMVNVGVTFALDRGKGVRMSKAALARKLGALTEENREIKQEYLGNQERLVAQDKELGALKAALARLEAKMK